jgi:D-glycero-D-manno-heptose 1,7-bisphosphate phosphatase
MSEPAVFLDRDGTLNVEAGYVHRAEDWHWLPGVLPALARLRAGGFRLVVVTNQSGVFRGYYGEDQVRALHAAVAREAPIDAFYFCPHDPAGTCPCRKPAPGMLLRAARDLDLDLARSWMVGDKLLDVQAGLAAGVRPVHVLTGHGPEHRASLPPGIPGVPDLAGAAHLILA